jgi:hypothetical protein
VEGAVGGGGWGGCCCGFFFLLFLSGLDWVMLGWGDPMVCLYFGRGEGFFLDQTLDGDSF